MTITDRIRNLCESNGITINKLEKELVIGRGNIGRWHKHKPNSEELLKVANKFNVSVEYLLTGEQKEKPAPEVGNELEILDKIIDNMSREELLDFISKATQMLRNK